MPVTLTYPGIYVQELPSSVHTITAAPTNVAVFIGYTHPLKNTSLVNGTPQPQQLFGFNDYVRAFGGFVRSTLYANDVDNNKDLNYADMAIAVNQFFLNGGTEAWVVGLQPQFPQRPIAPTLPNSTSSPPNEFGTIVFTAREVTDATFQLSVLMTPNFAQGGAASSPPMPVSADVIITYGPKANAGGELPAGTVTETYRGVTLTKTIQVSPTLAIPDPNFIETRIGAAANSVTNTPAKFVSNLVTVSAASTGVTPAWPHSFPANPQYFGLLYASSTSTIFEASDYTSVMAQDTALDKLDVFNLMVLPGVTNTLVLSMALAFCEAKRAFLIMDPKSTATADNTPDPTNPGQPANPIAALIGNVPKSSNSALYFPYLLSPDPVTGSATNPVTGKVNEIPPAATVAGVFAATDGARGVWKAPAGFAATTNNTTGVVARGKMSNMRQGTLNPLGVNCLRDFANIGTAVFGARTLVTLTDQQWRYVPVRRTALFLEQSLAANLTWVVFEPNADPLWAAIRLTISAFMLSLFNQGAFQGTKPSEAFFVKCDSQTTTQTDIEIGMVNIVVGFAPLLPAEFVVISVAQLAGQSPAG
jgi:Bacteriophage tail sheath protein